MFDPTIYDNVKVVLEGEVYDRDLAGDVEVIGRSDSLDLAVMSRCFQLQLRLTASSQHSAAVVLSVSAEQLVNEITEREDKQVGCSLTLHFDSALSGTEETARAACEHIRTSLLTIWGDAVRLQQSLRTPLAQNGLSERWYCYTEAKFHRVIDETHIEDIPRIIDTIVVSLRQLENQQVI